jgi:fructose-bisphosphate aldolase class I
MLGGTAKLLFADNRGLLAMDESNETCNKRFKTLGIPRTVEARRAYREIIVTTPGLGGAIGGAIPYDETIRQKKIGQPCRPRLDVRANWQPLGKPGHKDLAAD